MTTRFDICAPRPKRDGGTFWHRIGTMMPNDKGGFMIYLDSLPMPDKEGRCAVAAFAPKDQDDKPARKAAGGYANRVAADLDDSIPFGPDRN